MKIDLTQPILGFDNEPILNGKGNPVEIGTIIRNVLGSPIRGEKGDEKLKRYKVGLKCVADTTELDETDRTLIKDLLGNEEIGVSPVVYGRILEAISDPKE